MDDKLKAVVNPHGTMYNPASVLHTIEATTADTDVAIITLGTNHIYRLRATGEIVDNCQKRPQTLFQEEELTITECADYLQQAIDTLRRRLADTAVVITVSPIRYRKYGYHRSRLSKATLLLAADKVVQANTRVEYFPAYEIMNDELRDYRFTAPDMLHPTPQAADYIYQRFADTYFAHDTLQYLEEWRPIHAALKHRPLNPDSDEYRAFRNKALQAEQDFNKKWKQPTEL